MSAAKASHTRTNHLAREKSPYLLQHAHNPVDWYPWGEEAFKKARDENKPVFLSVGYSTCHWCHVMERESFEDEQIGEVLNRHFVSVKVDREERPDVDKIYMTFVQATTGSGGWPMNVFLTPDLKPFYGGTYFPAEPRLGRPGLLQLLHQVIEVWRTKHDQIRSDAAQMHAQLAASLLTISEGGPTALGADLIRKAGQGLKQLYDSANGGFGTAPKFPQPSQPELLLRYAARFNDSEAREMVLTSCRKMAAGGIYDQLGGGFARYSVDAQWLVPHFEKMLYDNAQLLELYGHAYAISGDKHHAHTARGIINYVLRDMTHPEGGFYSAEDADSDGHEGKFYSWTRGELNSLLEPVEFEVACRHFGITDGGNFIDHSHPAPLPGQNVLSIAQDDLTLEEQDLLNTAMAKMIARRNTRTRPQLDDKILTSWNGLMLGALAKVSLTLDDFTALRAAEQALAFIQTKLWNAGTGMLHHRWRHGDRDSVQLLDDYAFLLDGVLHLYETTLEPAHLRFAIELADRMLERFHDQDRGGFWQTAADDPYLICRVKEDYDGAEPSGNSVAALSLLRLGAITAEQRYRDAGMKTLQFFGGRLAHAPLVMPRMLQAVDFALQEPHRVVVSGDPGSQEVRRLLQAVHSVYQPNTVILGTAGPVEPFARTLPSTTMPQVYLCTGEACHPPTDKPEELYHQLLSLNDSLGPPVHRN